METSEAKELLDLLSEQKTGWQGLWTTFYTVGAATLTLIASGKISVPHLHTVSLLASLMFLFFAAGNYQALDSMRRQRLALMAFMREKAADSPHIMNVVAAAGPPSQIGLRVYHWGLSLLIVALLNALPLFQTASTKG
ncbi:hypothetical protein [Desulfobulbus propionicus]